MDDVFKKALVLDLPDLTTLDDLFAKAAGALEQHLEQKSNQIERMLWERERASSTAISPFIAVPHLVLDVPGAFMLLAVRAPKGISFTETYDRVNAIFVLAGSADKRTLHLQTLAALAQIAMDPRFEAEWTSVRKPEQLREVLLLGERRRLGRTENA